MPRSKPSKKVSLTKTKKKTGIESKHIIIEEIRKGINTYENIFVFNIQNLKNKFINEIRMKWNKNSRIFLCKNRIMALAIGRTPSEEISENLHLVADKLMGNRGLFFTNSSKEEVLNYFDNYKPSDYASAGCVATETFDLPEGPQTQFSHSIEPYLRKLGLPVELQRGVPALLKPYTVCKKGDILNPEQAKLLKLFEKQISHFKITMEFMWSSDGSFNDLGRTNDVIFTKKSKKAIQSKRNVSKTEKKIESIEKVLDDDEITTETQEEEENTDEEEMEEDEFS